MKNLGLDKKLSDVDDIMTDLEETHSDVKDINNILSQKMSFHEDEFDDNDIEEELNILMGIESEECKQESSLMRNKLIIKSSNKATLDIPTIQSTMTRKKRIRRITRPMPAQ
mmetsp:Transcript_10068/g.33527  ORF Transcript_10068/g.33527 Transcript_10068/m.33527 type:complete len:112 (-) Transcript_10068:8-343(-)